jgi:hypothetical protein
VESDLRLVKEQLRNTENTIAYLSDMVRTYRHRWLEEYHRANNLERHMPCHIHVPDLAQIAEGASSPGFFRDFLECDAAGEGSEREE